MDEASAFDEIGITNTFEIGVEESNLLDGDRTNHTNENMNEMNENTMHIQNQS